MLGDLITPGTAYNSSFCYNVSRGRLITLQCDYPFVYQIENILYRTVFGCFFDFIELLLLGALWFCNIWIQRDFTEAYMSSVAVPLSASTAMKIAIFVWDFLFPRDLERSWLIDTIYATTVTTAQITMIQGLPFFLYMAMKVGTSRRQNYGFCTWVPYLLILVFSFPLAGVFNILYKPTYAAPSLVAILALIVISLMFMFAFIGMGCMTFACCTKHKPTMDMLDPVVYDARSRLGWAMLFSFAAPLTSYPCFYCFVKLAFFLDLSNDYDVLGNEMTTRVFNFFFGPSFLVFTFLILPSYRDTILCGCKYRRFTKKVMMNSLGAPAAQGITAQIHVTETITTPVVPLQQQTTVVAGVEKPEPVFVTTSSAGEKRKPYPIQNFGPAPVY